MLGGPVAGRVVTVITRGDLQVIAGLSFNLGDILLASPPSHGQYIPSPAGWV
jgi:hypothetical protein